MNQEQQQRRKLLKAGLATSLLLGLPISTVKADTKKKQYLELPESLREDLKKIYGRKVRRISVTNNLKLELPDIAENGAVVGMRVSGKQHYASSLVILVERSFKPVATRMDLYEGADFTVGTRLKIGRSSNVYCVAKTREGLVGTMKNVKVTIGCGGG